jgi:hypothetical protein
MDFQEQRGAPGCGKKSAKIAGFGIVHASASVSTAQIIFVQRMPLAVVAGNRLADDEVGIALQAASLRTIGLEVFHLHATGRAGVALRALRKIQVTASPTKPLF